MRNNFSLLILMILAVTYSCSSLKVGEERHQKTQHNKILGSFNTHKTFILNKDYNTVGFPNYIDLIKVTAKSIRFNKRTYKAFLEAKAQQNKTLDITYNDSLSLKPQYIQLEITDRITILEALKSEANQSIYQFLKNNEKVQLVSSIAMACRPEVESAINKADHILLNTSNKNYQLQLFSNGVLQQTISFKEVLVFAYQNSQACWKQNGNYEHELIDLVETNDKCPKGSYNSINQAKQ